MTATEFWKDYIWFLLPGKVDQPQQRNLDLMDMTNPPYREAHKGQEVIVFFREFQDAKDYMAMMKLVHYSITTVPADRTNDVIRGSAEFLRCNAAFLIRRQGEQWIRDVSELPRK